MNRDTLLNYPDRRGDSLMNPNCNEMRDDLRATVTRIRHYDTQGDTQLANALRFTARRLRNAIRLAETQVAYVAPTATYLTIRLHETQVL